MQRWDFNDSLTMKMLIIWLVVAVLSGTSLFSANSWSVGCPVLSAGPEGSFDDVAVKDPSLVYYKGRWHLFYTAAADNDYTTGYVSADSLDGLKKAERHQLTMIRGIKRYGCAPQVFYFAPQKLWYLVFQTKDSNYQPAYSINVDVSIPGSWSKPQPLLVKDAKAKWIDFWIICDRGRAYLFYTEAHNGVVMRSTSLKDFPGGWSKAHMVYSNIHEAVHIYKVRNKREFHMFYELNNSNVRSFGMARAQQLDGPWVKVTNEYATCEQLKHVAPVWTEMVSHGEVLRAGFDEKLEYNPVSCRWLVQGILQNVKDCNYPSLPWQLGVIKLND